MTVCLSEDFTFSFPTKLNAFMEHSESQYSLGSSTVVMARSASVMIQMRPAGVL